MFSVVSETMSESTQTTAEGDQGENDEIDVVSMDTSPGARGTVGRRTNEEEAKDENEKTDLMVNEEHEIPDVNICYCGDNSKESIQLQCEECKKNFHFECLKTGPPTSLEGDSFFKLTCSNCASDGQEDVERLRLTWQQVVILTLFNLSLQRSGRRGFFRWKEDICDFIAKNWSLIFGSRPKSQTWHGTVAGVLSVGNKQWFRSGAGEFGESGWWALVENKPPVIKPDTSTLSNAKPLPVRRPRMIFDPTIKVEGLRNRKRGSSFESAIELKEKRSRTQEAKDIRKAKLEEVRTRMIGEYDLEDISRESFNGSESSLGGPPTMPDSPPILSLLGGDNSCDSSVMSGLLTESDLALDESMPSALMEGDEEDDLMSIPSRAVSRVTTPIPSFTLALQTPDPQQARRLHRDDDDEYEGTIFSRPGEIPESIAKISKKSKPLSTEVKKRRAPQAPKFLPMSIYEERQLLKFLENCPEAVELDLNARRLRRKLLVRQEKRQRGLPLLDLDATLQSYMQSITNTSAIDPSCFEVHSPKLTSKAGQVTRYSSDFRILDRFQIPQVSVKNYQMKNPTFRTRLVGCQDEISLQSICSPYTARVLKPFIRRDFESRPVKLRLLEEVMSYQAKIDPTFTPDPVGPIDYCYVRPQHIPSVNALCREFFWPGVDLSECLQYSDFSVVALYKKVVIGFGFMVPDVKYNEAYISFLFVHPEWRGAGIGTFMVYHLIQTCMGKDVTLHVSATNSAMLLYQRFGFKPEEFIIDFYDKYYPEESKECRHAFLLRLKR
ncbi:cysteine-rich protein 2-binding protein-like [Anneissia japonica]|uniref:cysteine-rich protein 2-binding protein-like n=1 Tax=Anneissia japonica TaxID=1529436 RepID=UPI0014255A0C|nr:cysteine-rich protein 2-binding protein-like [Anneissia japonica]